MCYTDRLNLSWTLLCFLRFAFDAVLGSPQTHHASADISLTRLLSVELFFTRIGEAAIFPRCLSDVVVFPDALPKNVILFSIDVCDLCGLFLLAGATNESRRHLLLGLNHLLYISQMILCTYSAANPVGICSVTLVNHFTTWC